MNRVGTFNEANRAAWLEEALKQIPAGSRILDAGAGEQQFKKLCSHLSYVAQDFAKYDGEGDHTGLHMGSWNQTGLDIVSDIAAIPEPDASFDAVMCVEVFEHLPAPLLALREFRRLIKPHGHLIITAPFCSLTHFAPYHYYTGFNRYFYETHLSANGFEIVDLQANGNFFEFLAQELRRTPSVAEQYSKDRPGRLETRALDMVLGMLNRFSRNDTASNDLLHFGYHVRAVKQRET